MWKSKNRNYRIKYPKLVLKLNFHKTILKNINFKYPKYNQILPRKGIDKPSKFKNSSYKKNQIIEDGKNKKNNSTKFLNSGWLKLKN